MKKFILQVCITIFFCLIGISNGKAVTWQWSKLLDRERVVITLDKPNQGKVVSRVGATTLEVPLTGPVNGLVHNGQGPLDTSIVSSVTLNEGKLYITLHDAAFGYATRVGSAELTVDIFSDPLGNRWRDNGTLASASAPSRASSALPDVPNTSSPQIKPDTSKASQSNSTENTPQVVKDQPLLGKTEPSSKIEQNKTLDKQSRLDKNIDISKNTQTSEAIQTLGSKDQAFNEVFTKEENQPPPPSVDELTKITNKIDNVFPNSDEYSWTRNQSEDLTKNSPLNTQKQNSESQTDKTQQASVDNTVSSDDKGSFQDQPNKDEKINSVRANMNTKGPDAWPKDKVLTTVNKLEEYLHPAGTGLDKEVHQETIQQPSVEPETKDEEKKNEEIIYVDEKGNPVAAPLDVPVMIQEAKKELAMLQFEKVKGILTALEQQQLTQEQKEEILYLWSELNEKMYKDRWLEGYEPIVSTTNAAMNANLRSPRVAEALMRLGMINLLTGNQDEAEGYFGALRRKFPQDPSVTKGYTELGKDQFKKKQYADAVKTFQLILDNYPESKAVQDASRYMAEALFRQGHYNRALVLVDFIDRRWHRLYLEDPSYLTMVGDLYDKVGRLDDALKYYWTHYNLTPQDEDNHELLFKIGTIYFKKGLLKAGKDIFEELLKKYPKSESAPKSLLALGEEQVPKENPTLEELFTVFQNPSSTIPEIYYKKILTEYPNSPEAKQAEIRQAIWKLWNRDIPSAMILAQQFLDQNSGSPYSSRAEEIILRGFDQTFALALQEENYERILSLWEKYPSVQVVYKNMRDDLRVALARAYLNRGNEEKGMEMLEPFLETPQNPTYGDYVYNLYLARYLRNENWDKILELGEKVANWNLPTSAREQLDYAMAIAAENLGLGNKALPLWSKLYQLDDIPLYQKAYATYFMARDAERRRDLNAAYKLNLDTLKLFMTLEEERSDKADPERIRESISALMDVTEVANRFSEALEWADKYEAFIPENSPDYAGFLFRKARLYRKIGDLDKWKQLLEKIVTREPESVFGKMAGSELRNQAVSRDLNRFKQ